MELRKKFYLLLLIGVSVFMMLSCSDDNEDVTDGESGTEQVSNPAGDDFYMFVNGEWHDNLTNKEEPQGYISDYEKMLAEMTEEATEYMEDYQTVMQSLEKRDAGDQQANIERVEEIVNEIIGDIKTKEDAYIAIGKCVRMGLVENEFKLYMTYDEQKIRYSIGPSEIDEDKQGDEAMKYNGSRKKTWKNYVKNYPKTRTADKVLEGIIEGLEINPEYYLHVEEFVDETLSTFNGYTLDELVDYIQNSIRISLYPYCFDDVASEVTEGLATTTAEFLECSRDELFAYSIAYQFNELYVTDENKAAVEEYAEELRRAFAKRLENNEWLSKQTKLAALEKLAKMRFFFGGPDEWYETGFPKPEGKLLVDDILEVKASRIRLIEALQDESIMDKTLTIMMFEPDGNGLNTFNAVYYMENNSINIFPQSLFEPDFSLDMEPWNMYGAFFDIGHEITHGFDKEGSKYDGDGLENDWWTPADRAAFLALNEKFSAQISTFEAAPGIMTDGERTNTEDVADLGGFNIAFDAMTEYLKSEGVEGDELEEAQKKFFIRHAKRYCSHYTQEILQELLNDVHSVAKIRVNGIVQHVDKWYDLFNVKEGDNLYLPKEERVVIW